MNAYSGLAANYDALTGDVDYEAYLGLYKKLFLLTGTEVNSVLDLGCGTGSLSILLAKNGYDITAVDAQPEMLSEAAQKLSEEGLTGKILLLNQRMEELDLYGTVDAAVSSLDCLNYVRPENIGRVFGRLRLFIRPGGVLIFDIITPERFQELDGQVFCDEQDGLFCVWRAEFDPHEGCCRYALDCFEQSDDVYIRTSEEHDEYAHRPNVIKSELENNGFKDIRILGGFDAQPAAGGEARLFFFCRR